MLAILLFSTVHAAPFVLFDKKVVEESGKVGEPLHVIYTIYNLGDAPMTNLHIEDAAIPREQWQFPEEAGNIRWDYLAAGDKATYVFEATPLVAGNLRMGSSKLSYMTEGEKKIALSSQLFWFDSKASRSIGAKSNLCGYTLVVLVAAASIFVPFFLWTMTAQKPKAKTH